MLLLLLLLGVSKSIEFWFRIREVVERAKLDFYVHFVSLDRVLFFIRLALALFPCRCGILEREEVFWMETGSGRREAGGSADRQTLPNRRLKLDRDK